MKRGEKKLEKVMATKGREQWQRGMTTKRKE